MNVIKVKKTPAELAQEISGLLSGHEMAACAGAIARVLIGLMMQVPPEHKARIMQMVTQETQRLVAAMEARR